MKKIFIGIDVSKGHADFSIVNEQKLKVYDNFKLFDNAEGHIMLINFLKKLKSESPKLSIYCAMESTGRYEKHWNDLLRKFTELVERVYIVNGYKIKYYHKSLKEKNKTDSISSFVIAHYLSAHYNDLISNSPYTFTPTAQIVKSIDLIDKSIVATTNRLNAEVYAYFPEFNSILEAHLSAWHLKFLQKYPTSFHAKHGRVETMKKIPFANHDKIDVIKKQVSIAIRPLGDKYENESCGDVIRSIAKEILALREKKENYLQLLDDNLNKTHVQLLETIPGIGKNLALQLLTLIGDIKRFDSPRKLASFFGVHPILQNSGNVVRSRMKKQGNPLARKLLYSVALQMCREISPFYFLFERYTKQMGNKMKAIGKCMHLAVKVIWAILYYEQVFDIEKFIRQHTRRGTKKDYAMDDFSQLLNVTNNDFTAPISAKKKKEIRNKIKEEVKKKRAPTVSRTTVSSTKLNGVSH